MKSKSNLILVLGNQLFSKEYFLKQNIQTKDSVIFMREDLELCTYYKFHKHKIIFFLAAMRAYRDELEEQGFEVHYEELEKSKKSYEESLLEFIKKNKIKTVFLWEIEDKFFEQRIISQLKNENVIFHLIPSPMFLTSREQFQSYVKKNKRPFMKIFYESQRKKLNLLLEKNGEPEGGRWSFDTENRLALPAKVNPPPLPEVKSDRTLKVVQNLVDKNFPTHPGASENFWLPHTRASALQWLDCFLDERLPHFGPYEDAIPKHSDFVFHSVLTPFLNTGLLTPEEVIQRTLTAFKKRKLSIASVEGFVRQIIGWREFIRGIYQNFSEKQESSNFFNHKRKLTHHWYDGTTGVAPLDHAIKKTVKYGYAHHIERLMVLGSLMLLLEIQPKEAHRWFMEMFIDSSDWVMGPNVYGMALFSDGGIFATKPYFCGSNYYRKMGGYKANEEWCDAVDGLYWSFVEKHKTFFLKNPRLSMMARSVEKMDETKKQKIYKAAEELRKKITRS